MSLRKQFRRYIARPGLQPLYRFLYRFALAGMNYGGAGSAGTSGDVIPVKRLSRMQRRAEPFVVFDVGANIGGYVSEVVAELGDDVQIHAFEPSSAAFATLQQHFGGRSNVHLVQAGLGAEERATTLFAPQAGSVLASTYASPLTGSAAGEQVRLLTLDSYCARHGISTIDLLKLDVEGAELDVLRGGVRMLEAGALPLIQFEFGPPNVSSRTYFHDLFELINERYVIYRLLPSGLSRLAAYEYGLEVFLVTNYLAVLRTHVAELEAAS